MDFSLWKQNTWGCEIPGDMIGALSVPGISLGCPRTSLRSVGVSDTAVSESIDDLSLGG